MKKYLIIGGLIVVPVCLLVVGLVLGATVLGKYNQCQTLQTNYKMKISANKAELDDVKKSISQVAEVSDQMMDKLAGLFRDYATGRTTDGQGQMMAWIKEAVPNVSPSTDIYKSIINIITSKRESWKMRQVELVSIAEQHNLIISPQPWKYILMSWCGVKWIDPLVVTSSAVNKAFETGVDDDASVFKK